MAQMVCIAEGTKRDDNEIGDIVSIHDDDVLLSGIAYSTFEIVIVDGLTAEELTSELEELP